MPFGVHALTPARALILLDRDGVLNDMVVDPEHGTIDSPLAPDQVRLKRGVPEALAQLTAWGLPIAVVTNQPSAAKGKTTLDNLHAVQARVLELASAQGGRIFRWEMCVHRAEDGCACRKPKPGMLAAVLRAGNYDLATTWMVGDGITDVQAGRAAGVRTAFLGSKRCDVCRVLTDTGSQPELHVTDLPEFVATLGRLWDLKSHA